jgi:hypothetical protein
MTLEEMSSIKRMLVDLRFIQASALVASGLSDTKESRTYMRDINRLEKVLNDEIHKELIK